MNITVRKAAEEELGGCDRIHIIEPIDVFDCHNVEARCFLCLTDSGGIQEEVPSYGKPVFVMRDTTERPEGEEAGTLKLVGTDEEVIYQNFKLLLENEEEYNRLIGKSKGFGGKKDKEVVLDVVCEFSVNTFAGKEYPQMIIKNYSIVESNKKKIRF